MQRLVLSAGVNKNFDDDGLPSLCISACRELGNCETGIGEVADDICSADIGILPGSAARRSTITAIVSWLSEDVQRRQLRRSGAKSRSPLSAAAAGIVHPPVRRVPEHNLRCRPPLNPSWQFRRC